MMSSNTKWLIENNIIEMKKELSLGIDKLTRSVNNGDPLKLLKFGSDPEAIIYDENGKPCSSIDKIPGSKYEPYDIGCGCAVQTDNVLVEWCLPATTDPKVMSENMQYCLAHTIQTLPQGFTIKFSPSEIFSDEELSSDQAKIFGCEPDYNAWKEGDTNPKPEATNSNLRTCGKSVCHLN